MRKADRPTGSPRSMSRSPAAQYLLVLGSFGILVQLLCIATAQNQSQPTTDPDEARTLNSIFQQWRISANQAQWNISGELCSGAAVNSTSLYDGDYNPFMKCNCTLNNGSTGLITQLKVFGLDVVGVIPDAVWNLTFLTILYAFYLNT